MSLTTTTTFNDVFKMTYIRSLIFNHIDQIFKVEYDAKRHDAKRYMGTKGRDIIQLPCLAMISKYAMPLQFIRHYLPSDCNQVLPQRRAQVIDQYCRHPNATLDTLKYLLEWSSDCKPVDRDMINIMVENEKIELVEFIIKNYPYLLTNQYIRLSELCRRGYLSAIKLLYTLKNVKLNDRNAMNTASCKGFIDIVKYLHERNVDSSNAMGCLNLEMIKYLHYTVGAESSSGTLCAMTKDNNDILEIVKFFHGQEKHQDVFNHSIMRSAAEEGLLDVVEFLHYNRSEGASSDTMDEAAKYGQLDIVKFLHFNRSEGATTRAIDYCSDLETIKFLHFNRTEGATTHAMDRAASKRHIEIVKFLDEHRTEGATTDAMDLCSDLEIVKFLHFNRTEGATTKAMDYAAEMGNIEIIEFLHQHRQEGCTTNALENAIKNGHTETIEYLVQVIKCKCSSVAVQTAIEKGRLDIISLLYDNYPNNNDSDDIWKTNNMDLAAKLGFLDIVLFLHQHRQEGCTTDALDNACKFGFMDIVLFLHQHRTEGATHKALCGAASNGHFEMVQFLYNNRQEEVDIARALESSCFNSRIEIVSFLVDILIKEKEEKGLLTVQQQENIEKAIISASALGRLAFVQHIILSLNITTLSRVTVSINMK
ncbi:hypothetical protein DFA_04021 [Cavenderia fasciculata]|uniref:Ankyrin repeat-containing protein n=1 Tax=Cavenderia fasciculata TaxID=261658 RepID=F4Q126_CACFS|nr:uncharacterized protein DFA_04021 [Cavenderia fasciculata]EGG18527.1 hypothetical protein DFA_04021 [Cavenderia fasciculata]|eukprot:XP_004366431.1 hypothetical protein DFA_04021 [Cavenderia fasciculata]